MKIVKTIKPADRKQHLGLV